MIDKKQITTKEVSTDADLLLQMSWKEDQTNALHAFESFYRRHIKYVSAAVFMACRKYLKYNGTELQENVLTGIFQEIFQNPDRLINVIGKLKNQVRIKERILAEIGRIGEESLMFEISEAEKYRNKDELRNLESVMKHRKGEINLIDQQSYDAYEDDPEHDPPDKFDLSEWIPMLEQARCQIKAEHWEITMACLEAEHKGHKLPSEFIDEIATRHNKLPDNIRQIKHRTILKLKSVLQI